MDHSGHKQRLRDKMIKGGLENFPPHEVLEVMLSFPIVRKNTNPLAHQLIQKYGSLSAVLDADYEELLTNDGVGEKTAFFLKSIPALCRYYMLDKQSDKEAFDNSDIAGEYAAKLFVDKTKECVYILCLDVGKRLINTVFIKEGGLASVELCMRDIAAAALSNNANSIILLHNHTTSMLQPSHSDLIATAKVIDAMDHIGIGFDDHIIVNKEGNYLSFEKSRLISVTKNLRP